MWKLQIRASVSSPENKRVCLQTVRINDSLGGQKMKTTFTNKNVRELIEAGKKIDVKVTPDSVDGELVVNIRDYQFHDKIQAQIYLTSIAESELPHNHEYLIG